MSGSSLLILQMEWIQGFKMQSFYIEINVNEVFSPRAPELRSALLLPPPLMFVLFLSITVAVGTVFTI